MNDTKIYIGPYIFAKPIKTTKTMTSHSCPTRKCQEHGIDKDPDYKFCTHCGAEMVDKSKDRIRVIDLNDEVNEYDDHKELEKYPDLLAGENMNRNVCISLKNSISKEIDANDTNFAEEMSTPFDSNKAIQSFKKTNAKDIQKLKDAGFNVEVKWGLLIYEA